MEERKIEYKLQAPSLEFERELYAGRFFPRLREDGEQLGAVGWACTRRELSITGQDAGLAVLSLGCEGEAEFADEGEQLIGVDLAGWSFLSVSSFYLFGGKFVYIKLTSIGATAAREEVHGLAGCSPAVKADASLDLQS